MRINHNVAAMNTHRQMGISEGDGSKSMEKLSSGFRINRAGDDAAGLAISEKMRAQIKGLNMASKNSSDTISLIQTAEGALGETHSILQRIRELAVQSANDTNTNADRDELQSEVKQLKAEIDRIGNTTEFNTKKLLEGSAKGVSDEIVGTSRINNNSSLLLDAGKMTKMGENISNDKSWAFDGAYMLVRTGKSGNGEYNASDFMLVGPDGSQYKFKAYTPGTKTTVSDLEAGTIIAEGGESKHYSISGTTSKALSVVDARFTTTNPAIIGATLDDKTLESVGGGSILAAGSSFTLTGAGTTSVAVAGASGINDVKLLGSGDLQLTTTNSKTLTVAVGKTVTLDDGTVLKNNGAGKVSVENGGLTLGTGGLNTAGGATANVSSLSIAAQSRVSSDSNVKSGERDITYASYLNIFNTALLGTFQNNITIGNSTGLVGNPGQGDLAVVAEGSILAKGSMLSVKTGAEFSLKIEVAGKEVDMSYKDGIFKVGGEVVASGKSITLEDGTVLTNSTILDDTTPVPIPTFTPPSSLSPATTALKIFVEQGSIKLAETIDGRTTTWNNGYIIAKDSTIAAGSMTGKKEVYLMAGTVINDEKTVTAGSITLANQGSNVQFSANTGAGLEAKYAQADVGDSVTFIFSNYQAPSSKLNDSVMAQIGANSGQTAFVSIGDMRAKALGVADVDVSTKWGAATAIETVNNALQKVSHQRSSLGAIQNRLEHTIKNLDTAAENLQAAESRIRDVDMAKEIMEFTKNNILQQASQAMLAQANSQPQSVLALLR